jgi:hypothetical protein
MNYFLPNVTDVRAHSDPIVSAFLATKDGQTIAKKFPRIASSRMRRALIDIIDDLTTE